MFKKLCIFLFLGFVLFSCGEEQTVSSIPEGLSVYEGDGFSMGIPSSWETIKNDSDVLPEPSAGTIVLAAHSKDVKGGFKNNIVVLSERLNSFATAKDFSILNHLSASRDYEEYQELGSKEIVFENKQKSILYIFEARYNTDTPKLKFFQTAHICNQNQAFLITLSLSNPVGDFSRYEYLLSTFRCSDKDK